MIKLAIVTNRFYPEVGGVETNLYFQATRLAERCDVTVFCPKRIQRPPTESLNGFTVRRLMDLLNLKKVFPNLKAKTFCPGLFFKIIFGGFDVVQCFPAINYNNILAWLACKISGTPYVLVSFDFLDYATILKKTGRISNDILVKYKARKRESFLLPRMDHIFAISNKEINFFKKYNKNVEYSPVPILLDEYEKEVECPREKYGLKKSDFIFLSLGRVCNVKGQDIALKAFARAIDKLGDARMVFVGRSDYAPDFLKNMKDFIKEQGLEDRVIFTGVVERDEVLGWLRGADIHVIPVRFMNSGAVVVETWISGTPVVQSDIVDPNLVVEDQNGFLFKSEDVESCSKALIKAYENRDKFPKLAADGMALVKTKYTYEYLTNLYMKCYERLLAGKRRS